MMMTWRPLTGAVPAGANGGTPAVAVLLSPNTRAELRSLPVGLLRLPPARVKLRVPTGRDVSAAGLGVGLAQHTYRLGEVEVAVDRNRCGVFAQRTATLDAAVDSFSSGTGADRRGKVEVAFKGVRVAFHQ